MKKAIALTLSLSALSSIIHAMTVPYSDTTGALERNGATCRRQFSAKKILEIINPLFTDNPLAGVKIALFEDRENSQAIRIVATVRSSQRPRPQGVQQSEEYIRQEVFNEIQERIGNLLSKSHIRITVSIYFQ